MQNHKPFPAALSVRRRRQRIATLGGVFLALGLMLTLVSYSVTLYRLFCQATGAGGTTQRVAANDSAGSGRPVVVRFNTDTAPGLPWRFAPVAREVRTRLGEDTLVFFRAENLSDHELVGHATFNVTPEKTGPYFKKIQCFCFDEERLAAHASVEMPVDFFVDPRLADDPNTRDVTEITLSYTFFPSHAPAAEQGVAKDLSRFDAAPDPAAGELLFAASCAGCHALDHSKVGPSLGGVVGRAAGSVAGYAYSQALAQSGAVWDAANLDRWLAGPAAFIPGAQMPMAVADPAARRDIVAYLRTIGAQTPAEVERGPSPSRPPG